MNPSRLGGVVGGPHALRRWAVASLAVNILLVATGALVRLTGSGLGCPTWPRCTELSYASHPELGYHGAIEFGNRLLTFVLVAVAVLTWLSAVLHREDGHPRPDLMRLSTVLALGIPAQAVIGGIAVLTRLNPFVVALHLLVSFVLIGLGVALVRRSRAVAARPADPVAVRLARGTLVLMGVTVWLGTVVTGSGPHAGDESAVRTGLDPALVSHVHGAAVWVTVAATVACVWLLRSRAALALLGVEVVQAGLGITQYHLGLPVALVVAHLLGAALAVALATNLALSVRPATPRPVEAQPVTREAFSR